MDPEQVELVDNLAAHWQPSREAEAVITISNVHQWRHR